MIGIGWLAAPRPSPALTITPAINNLVGESNSSFGNWTLGWSFELDNPTVINALGIYAGRPTGLRGTYKLAIWDEYRSLLASTTISGKGDVLLHKFAWRALEAPLSLDAGEYVVSASGNYRTNNDPYAYDPSSYTLADGVDYQENRYRISSNFAYPSNHQRSLDGTIIFGFFGGNFSILTHPSSDPGGPDLPASPVPVPLLGTAAAFHWSRRLRRRHHPSSRGDRLGP